MRGGIIACIATHHPSDFQKVAVVFIRRSAILPTAIKTSEVDGVPTPPADIPQSRWPYLRMFGHALLAVETSAGGAFTTRKTLARVQDGDPGMGMGIYAFVLYALGLLEGLTDHADPSKDKVGLSLASVAQPGREDGRIKEEPGLIQHQQCGPTVKAGLEPVEEIGERVAGMRVENWLR